MKKLIINSVTDAINVATKFSSPKAWQHHKKNIHFGDYYKLGIWYRGETEHGCGSLTPSVFRDDNFDYDETSMFHHFKLRMPQYRQEHLSSFDWLCLMQHYGLPTRLLDWSESILIALFFATEKFNSNKDANIWILNGRILNKISNFQKSEKASLRIPESFGTIVRAEIARQNSFETLINSNILNNCDQSDSYFKNKIPFVKIVDEIRTIYNKIQSKQRLTLNEEKRYNKFIKSLRMPSAVFPYRNNGRMLTQYSMFTIQGGDIPTLIRYNEERSVNYGTKLSNFPPIGLIELNKKVKNKFLIKVQIPSNKREGIYKQLSNIGIHSGTIYPETDKQTEYIKSLWKLKKVAK